ncbi:MAG: SDR family NAD(P)-dependent oxidoreductase [Pseudomonadota bacterium]|nr:SDR family NAD(P)-dependent oxidoreductase [Pseudomonadota bacterium]
MKPVAMIAGVGPGLGAGLVSAFANAGYETVGLSRRGNAHGAHHSCKVDLINPDAVTSAIGGITESIGPVDVYVHNAALLHNGTLTETKPEDFERAWRVAVLGAVNGVQAVLPTMLQRGSGSILVSGATASIRGGANFAAFASAKFALRGFTQSLAREVQPKGVHAAHVILDGLMRGTPSVNQFDGSDNRSIDPLEAGEAFVWLAKQRQSAWTFELDLRPQTEKF